MSSDRVVVSPVGRKWAAPETSGFSQTCNLLSQFLRGKGSSLKEVSPQIATQLETKDYNYKKEEIKLAEEEEDQEDHPQMTIFYAGKVTVLNHLLPDQANHLLTAFTTAAAAAATHQQQQLPPQPPPVAAAAGDLPIARRASLHRFLDKRKARVMAKAPYTTSSSKGFDCV